MLLGIKRRAEQMDAAPANVAEESPVPAATLTPGKSGPTSEQDAP
jgi:hypothetical protein